MIVDILDFIEVWWRSTKTILESHGLAGKFERSSSDQLNPSCSLNLRRKDAEVDFLVWESGEAELATREADGAVTQLHLDDVRNRQSLELVLSRLVALIDVNA